MIRTPYQQRNKALGQNFENERELPLLSSGSDCSPTRRWQLLHLILQTSHQKIPLQDFNLRLKKSIPSRAHSALPNDVTTSIQASISRGPKRHLSLLSVQVSSKKMIFKRQEQDIISSSIMEMDERASIFISNKKAPSRSGCP